MKLHTDNGERWVEGTVFEPDSLRLVSLYGIPVEAPLGGTLLIVRNDDQPGVIGEVGTILGRRRVNIANFALGRGDGGAIGVVNVDEAPGRANSRRPFRKSARCRRSKAPGSCGWPDEAPPHTAIINAPAMDPDPEARPAA